MSGSPKARRPSALGSSLTSLGSDLDSAVTAIKDKAETSLSEPQGAAAARIEAGRRLFPSIWINDETTKGGQDALGWYHEKKDEKRHIGLGPEHDWASNGADSFGLMCVVYEEPETKRAETYKMPTQTSWMAA